MALPHYYVFALLSPNGRLGPVSFAFLSILLALGHLWAFAHISHQNDGLTWNVYTIAVFAMLWMQFCILTRRSRDMGSSGALYIPALFIAVAIFLLTIDADAMCPDANETFIGEMVVKWGMRMLRGIYIALLILGIKAPGMDGPNAYGPEFGERAENVTRSRAMTAKIDASQPIHKYGRVNKNAPKWGNRRRRGFGKR